MGIPEISISIIGEEWAKKKAGIFVGEEGSSWSAWSHSSLVFGAVTVIGTEGWTVGVESGKAKRRN